MIDKKAKSCCFIGHREINESAELKKNLQKLLSDLINKGVKEFVFGDHSAFNDLCYLEITELKKYTLKSKEYIFGQNYRM